MKSLVLFLACAGALTPVAPVQAADVPTAAVADMLAYMREEEKLAHDVYLLFSQTYGGLEPGSKIFARIADSETRHTDAVKGLLDKYGLPDPAAATAPGEFVDVELQALYDALVTVGQAGYTEALGVGITIERKDMTDIVKAIEVSVAYPDVVQVYSNLLVGSEHHYDAFMRVLDAAEPDSTTADDGEGGGPGNGAGQGKGRGSH